MTTAAVGGHVCVAASFEVVPGYLVFLELNCNKKKKLDHFDAEITTRLSQFHNVCAFP